MSGLSALTQAHRTSEEVCSIYIGYHSDHQVAASGTSGNRIRILHPLCSHQERDLHFRLVRTCQNHAPRTRTTQPEVFHPLAASLRRHNEAINFAVTQVTEFPPAVRISALI